jgi:shikimate kinase
MKKELADYLNAETEKLKAKQRKRKIRPVVLTHDQFVVVLDALQSRYEFLAEFGSASRNERRQVQRVFDRVGNAFAGL